MSGLLEPSHEQWQGQVVQLAGTLGWEHLHVRRSIGKGKRWVTATNVKGWPDLFLWHPIQGRVMAAELKVGKDTLTVEQRLVLRSLEAAGIPTYVWRPEDLEAVLVLLSPPR